MWIEREISDTITELEKKKACIVLSGARQTGKTSLFEKLHPHLKKTSLDLPRVAEEAESNGEAFLGTLGTPAFIDEVQYAPNIFRYIKAEVDRIKPKTCAYYLTGSQKFELLEGVSDSLSGRAAVLDLHSLSHKELERGLNKVSEGDIFWTWVFQGGYPEIYEKELSPERFFSDYLATYIERDVRKVINIKNLRQFDLFLRLLSTTVGQLVSFQKIASSIGVSPTTIKSWIEVLEITNVIKLIHPLHMNPKKKIVKTPKLYFCDTGLACFLLGIRGIRDLQASPLLGAVFENHFFAQMLRSSSNQGRRTNIYFFRDHSANEVDFVEWIGGNISAYECKVAVDPKVTQKGFDALQAAYPDAQIDRMIVTPAREQGRIKSGVKLISSVR